MLRKREWRGCVPRTTSLQFIIGVSIGIFSSGQKKISYVHFTAYLKPTHTAMSSFKCSIMKLGSLYGMLK